jgi:hypothetical protein
LPTRTNEERKLALSLGSTNNAKPTRTKEERKLALELGNKQGQTNQKAGN